MTDGTAEVTQSEYEALAEFRCALRQFLHFSERAARYAGISPQQHQALLAIKGFPGGAGIHVGDLAQRLQIQPHSAVGLVNRLNAKGYISRQPDPHDRRRVFLDLTARGNDILQRLSASHREQLRILGPQLNRLARQLSKPAASQDSRGRAGS